MTKFLYEGTDADFNPVSGEIEAASPLEAQQRLSAQQIRVRVLTDNVREDVLADLSLSEAVEVQSQVRELIESGLPLTEGLRAAAEEFAEPGIVGWFLATFSKRGHARVRRALLRIADAVQQGHPIEDVMQSRHAQNEVGAIMRSGISSEATAMAVGEFSAYARTAIRLRGQVIFLFAYPVVVSTLAFVLLGAFLCFVVPQMKSVFEDFEMELPSLTLAVISVSDRFVDLGPRFVLTTPILVAALCVGAVLNARWARRILSRVPLLGQGFRNVDLSRLSHVLAIVLRHKAPVPNALRAGELAVDDRRIGDALVSVAEHIESGGSMPRAQAGLGGFPLAFVQAAHQTDDRSTVADALHSIADMFENRARAIMGLLVAVFQPVILIGIVATAGVCFAALMLPIIDLLGALV